MAARVYNCQVNWLRWDVGENRGFTARGFRAFCSDRMYEGRPLWWRATPRRCRTQQVRGLPNLST